MSRLDTSASTGEVTEPPPDGIRGRVKAWLDAHRGGLMLAATIALASSFLAEHYGAPAMLFALLIGMAFNFLADHPRSRPGIGFSSRTLLRIGVALLGLRLTFADVSQLGLTPILGVIGLLGRIAFDQVHLIKGDTQHNQQLACLGSLAI